MELMVSMKESSFWSSRQRRAGFGAVPQSYKKRYKKSTAFTVLFLYPEPGSNRHRFYPTGV